MAIYQSNMPDYYLRKQEAQREQFNNLLRMMMTVAQAQNEQGWKQKEWAQKEKEFESDKAYKQALAGEAQARGEYYKTPKAEKQPTNIQEYEYLKSIYEDPNTTPEQKQAIAASFGFKSPEILQKETDIRTTGQKEVKRTIPGKNPTVSTGNSDKWNNQILKAFNAKVSSLRKSADLEKAKALANPMTARNADAVWKTIMDGGMPALEKERDDNLAIISKKSTAEKITMPLDKIIATYGKNLPGNEAEGYVILPDGTKIYWK